MHSRGIAALMGLIMVGCTSPDFEMSRIKTVGKLNAFQATLTGLSQRNELNFKDMQQFLQLGISKKILVEPYQGYFERDGWGELFKLQFLGENRFEIRSPGPNGVFADRDDLSLEAELNKSVVSFRRIGF